MEKLFLILALASTVLLVADLVLYFLTVRNYRARIEAYKNLVDAYDERAETYKEQLKKAEWKESEMSETQKELEEKVKELEDDLAFKRAKDLIFRTALLSPTADYEVHRFGDNDFTEKRAVLNGKWAVIKKDKELPIAWALVKLFNDEDDEFNKRQAEELCEILNKQ